MDNAQLVKDFFSQMWARKSVDNIGHYFHDDAIFHSSEGECKGLGEITTYFKNWHTAFPDFHCDVEELIVMDQTICAVWSAQGTQTGIFRRYLPTGRTFKYSGMHLFSIVAGKIKLLRMAADSAPILNAINKVSNKLYSEKDFINNFNGPARAMYEMVLHISEPPKSIAQVLTDAFRQHFLQFPISSAANIPDLDRLMSEVKVSEVMIPVKGRELRTLLYQPNSLSSDYPPIMVYCHGGGWMSLNPERYDLPNRKLALTAGINILCVDYRLIPEYLAPASLDDCCEAYRWVKHNACELLHSNPDKVAVGGDSGGAPLATGIVLKMQDENFPLPNAVFIASPVTDMFFENYASYNENSFRNLIIEAGLVAFQRNVYLPYKEWSHPYYSPIYGRLDQFPPTFILDGALDPLAEQAQAFADKLKSLSREVEIELTPGMDHVYHIFLGLNDKIDFAYNKIADFLKRVLK